MDAAKPEPSEKFPETGRAAVPNWPYALFIEGTNACSAACVFCAYPQMERPKLSMPMELFKNVVDQYLAMGHGDVDLTPIVGDPFMDEHLFERLDDLRARPGVERYHFYTNAILMDEPAVARLSGHGARLQIYCSFGGFDRAAYRRIMGVDKFDAAAANIRRLVDRKISDGSEIRIQIELRSPESDRKGEFWDYLRRRQAEGAVHLAAADGYDNWGGRIAETRLRASGLDAKALRARRGPCHRLLGGPMILADGRVNACPCRDVEATLVIGDLKNQPLKEILSGPAFKALVDRQAAGDFPEACKDCTHYEPGYPDWQRRHGWRMQAAAASLLRHGV
ncbi:MAG: radical SAM protein [Elusimicrobiota bacterium]